MPFIAQRLLALIGLVASIPVQAVLGILVFAEDRADPLFRQERVGLNGKPFVLYKMRTMSVNAPTVRTHEISAAVVTRVGAFLRKTKLDELPQLINVVRGEMALIGPRPGLVDDHNLFAERDSRDVLSIRPGMTGLAQVRGIDMSQPTLLAETDHEYLHEKSFGLDWKILIATLTGSGIQDRVRSID